MYVVEILPLAKGVRAESLTYFSPEQVPNGTVVTAPMQSREIRGIVAQCKSAKDMKAALKEAPYEMKQITEIGKQIFFAQYITACRSFARFSGVTAGSAIRALTPTPIINNNEDLPGITSDIFLPDITAPQAKIIQASHQKQHGYLNSLIQSRLNDDESIFICTPTNHQATQVEDVVDTEATVIRIDGTLTKTTLLSRWREIVTAKKPIVIIGTAPYLSVPRPDLGLVVIMDEINSAYKMIERPHLDKRLFARHLAETYKRDCILSSNVLSIETIWEYRNNKLSQAYKPVFRYDNTPAGKFIDMKEISDISASGVKLFSPPVAQEIRKTSSQSQKMLLFVARRGRRPFTVCNDCGETVTCKRCGYPLVLTDNDSGNRTFICRTCNTKETSLRRCQECHSWRLEALGVGIDFVAEVLEENIPELNVFQVDGNKTSTEKQVGETLDSFKSADSGVLLTTQLGVNRLQEMVDISAVITADSLLALPDLSISEKLFSLLLSIREQTRSQFFVQSRAKHTDIFTQALAGNVTSFYRDQIKQREQFNYPPFSYLIKLSSSGKQSIVKKHMRQVKQLFDGEKLSIYPSSGGKKYSAHALLQIDRDRWVDDEILSKLYDLPLAIDINTHPRSLL